MNNTIIKNHQVILIPGLSDRIGLLQLATKWWKTKGIEPQVFRVGWQDGNNDIQSKINEIITYAEKLADYGKVSIIGTSAGGSLAINSFLKRPDIIRAAVSVCGRLRAGNHNWRSLEKKSASSMLFKNSVLLLQKQEPQITNSFRKRIMTVTALFGDELVPRDTSYIPDANNIIIPMIEHMASIALSLTLYVSPIINFIQHDEK